MLKQIFKVKSPQKGVKSDDAVPDWFSKVRSESRKDTGKSSRRGSYASSLAKSLSPVKRGPGFPALNTGKDIADKYNASLLESLGYL